MNDTNDMDCGAARDLMLDADMSELRGMGTGELARHIGSCSLCGKHAQRILKGYEDLDRGLDTHVAKRKRMSRSSWIPLPLAAAALLAVMLTNREDPGPEIEPVVARMFGEQPVVIPTDDKQAIIIEKNDLTVVWLY